MASAEENVAEANTKDTETEDDDLLFQGVSGLENSPKELSNKVNGGDYCVQTPNRATYFVLTPSRVLRSSAKRNVSLKTFNAKKRSIQSSEIASCVNRILEITTPKRSRKSKSLWTRCSTNSRNISAQQKSQKESSDVAGGCSSKGRAGSRVIGSTAQPSTSSFRSCVETHSCQGAKNMSRGLLPTDRAVEQKLTNSQHMEINSNAEVSKKVGKNFTLASKKVKLVNRKTIATLDDENLKPKSTEFALRRGARSKSLHGIVPVKCQDIEAKDKPREKSDDSKSPKHFLFKAQPVPSSLYKKPRLTKHSVNITVPISPAFSSKYLLRRRPTEQKESNLAVSQLPVNPTKVLKPKVATTRPKPFSFESKEGARQQRKAKKLEEISSQNKVTYTFKAKPAPTSSAILPTKQVKEPTKTKPFNLSSRKNAACNPTNAPSSKSPSGCKGPFKANRNYEKILKGEPWKPKLGLKRSTEPVKIVFQSELRAKKRKAHDSKLLYGKENADLYEVAKKPKMEEQIPRPALPEPHSRPVIAVTRNTNRKKSTRKLTVPISPNFSARFKR